MKYVAQYTDCSGTSLSAPVTKLPTGQWALVTANGPREITFYIYGNDVAGGFATFNDFRLEDVPAGLRGCDYISLRSAMYDTLPWPQKPAVEPVPQVEPEDFRLHLEADSDPFRALQATGAKAELEYRANRQHARRQALQTLNERDTRKAQEIRRIQTEYGALKRPRGKGVFIGYSE